MTYSGSAATVTPSSVASGSPSRQQIGLALSLLGKDVLAFHPRLSELAGSVPAGLMLSQSLYWMRMLLDRDDRDGWFWKTQQDWQRELALSKHEQATARRHLNALPCWQEQRRATHGRLHYRVDLDLLATQLDSDFSGTWSWHDRQQMLSLLGRPVLVFRPLADLCQSVTSAILLSHLLGVERYELRTRDSHASSPSTAWRTYQFDSLLRITGLSRSELIHARKTALQRGVIAERLTGAPPRAQWRIDFPALIRQLRRQIANLSNTDNKSPSDAKNSSETRVVVQFAGNQQSSLLETSKLEKPANSPSATSPGSISDFAENGPQTRMVEQFSEIRETEDTESGKQKIRIPANIITGFEKVCFPDSVSPNKGLTTLKTTTTPTSPAHGESGAVGGGGFSADGNQETRIPPTVKTGQQNLLEAAEIAWPNFLLPDECLIAQGLLAKVGRMAQTLLDEMAGQHFVKPVRQPLGYLRKLRDQVLEGTFLPSAAPRVAAQRAAQRAKRQQEADVKSTAPVPVPQALTEDQREARRVALASIRKAMFGERATALAVRETSCETVSPQNTAPPSSTFP